MQRYGYERYVKKKKYDISEDRYFVFDRRFGTTMKIATVYDVGDAELIVRALNTLDTLAQPSNHNTIENPMEIAA